MNGNVGEGYVVSQARERLLRLLSELFQLDRVDLDFGIYRIMNAKRDEVLRFLENDLLPEIGKALGTYENTERAVLEAELEAKIRPFREAALDEGMVDNIPAIRALREKLAALANPEDLESEIFHALHTFFSRYYKDGDFHSLRRYKPGVYAIPYEGEEVKLHWANADQYYVKSTEDFQDYRFQLPDGRHVHFRLVAAQTDRDNNKPASGEERRFVLRAENPVEPAGADLNIYFEYKAGAERQIKLNEETVRRIMEAPDIPGWLPLLCVPAPTPSNKDRTLLEKHLADYTAKNSFDYFIHKDLGGFLRRELDFYLKNEILRIDDLDTADNGRATHTLARLRAIKQVAGKLIDFLAQLEDFQKKLWLKKKFVVRADYCITLDRVPQELYPEIAANDAQREEWVRLFAIDEIKGAVNRAGYSAPLTDEFLRDNPHLVVDTRHFDPCFEDTLIQSIQDLDDALSGLLVRSENFQALHLLLARYRQQVKCIYIDPPYNTGRADFLYKDGFQHSSWLSLMEDRLELSVALLAPSGSAWTQIDDKEEYRLQLLLERLFPGGVQNAVVWAYGGSGRGAKAKAAKLPRNYDTLFVSAKDEGSFLLNRVTYPFSVPVAEAAKYQYKCDDGGWFKTAPRGDYTDESVAKLESEGRIYRTSSGSIRIKYPLRLEGGRVIEDKLVGDVWTDIPDMMHAPESERLGFQTQKPVALIRRVIQLSSNRDDVVLDYFGGSGTTGHTVIELNRHDGGARKYLLVEMGEHFDTVLKPRIQKVIYSKDWKDGKPVSREGSSHMFKYMSLESYEDTLNNLELHRPAPLELALEASPQAREDYLLHYMLDLDTRGSASLLDVDRFDDPFHYQLLITEGGESRPITVDLVETFNWLLGLRVHRIRSADGYRTVEGTDPDGRRVLVIWRVLKDRPHTDDDLEHFFTEQGYGSRPEETALDRIYVNGDCTLANLRRPQDRWDVLLTEAEFGRLMFADTDGAL